MAYDKRLHFAAGLLISVIAGSALRSPMYGLAAAMVAGVVKELRDWCAYRGFDDRDMLVTWLGGLVGCILLLLV